MEMGEFLQEGDAIELTGEHKVYAEVPKHFVYSGSSGDFSLTKSDVYLSGNFAYLQGRYIVTKTEITGGSSHGSHDYYPSGHKVTCTREDGECVVSFYQSGCFTAMIEDIKPIAKAKLEWKIESE